MKVRQESLLVTRITFASWREPIKCAAHFAQPRIVRKEPQTRTPPNLFRRRCRMAVAANKTDYEKAKRCDSLCAF